MDQSEHPRGGESDQHEAHSSDAPRQSPVRNDTPRAGKQGRFFPLALIPLLVAIISAILFYFDRRVDALEAGANTDPQLVIVDLTQLASTYPQGATTEEVERMMIQANDSLARLSKAGYVVLDSSAVLTAPNNLFLAPDMLLPSSESGDEQQ